jgi:epoxyqueuosine reductase QueG
MKTQIVDLCKKLGADIVGFAPIERFPENSAVRRLLPEAKTVIGLAFRVLRGIYRGVEEGSTYYQYTTMGVENMEETVMPMVSLRLSMFLEENGYLALPQRRHQQIMAEDDSTNPEVAYDAVFRGRSAELQMDFEEAAVLCGLGERGLHGALLTDDFGPFVRVCFVLTDAVIDPTPIKELHFAISAENA